MKSLFFFLLVLGFSHSVFAAQQAIADEGRELILNENGSWAYRSSDHFATIADGRRVRLKADGSWSFTDKKRVSKVPVFDQQYIAEKSVAVVFNDVVIETYRGKKSASRKSAAKKTQMVFYVSLAVAKNALSPVVLSTKRDDFLATDSDGRNYPVINVEQAVSTIQPGASASLIVRVDGSPHWWTTKSLELVMDKRVLGSAKNISLTRPLSTARQQAVDGFE